MKWLTIGDIKQHSRIDYACEDALLELYGEAAEDTTLNALGKTYDELIDDDADRNVLSLTSIDTSDQSVQDKGIQCANNAFHFRIVGNQKVTWICRIADFQVKVITVTMENPIGFLGGQS